MTVYSGSPVKIAQLFLRCYPSDFNFTSVRYDDGVLPLLIQRTAHQDNTTV